MRIEHCQQTLVGIQLAAIWADVEGIVRERVTGLRSEYPADLAIQTLEKSIADCQQQIRTLLAGLEGGPKQE